MKAVSRSSITELLQAWSSGDRTAENRLWPIVFDELNRLAHRYIRQERPDHTLQTGVLVNEAYMRLVDWKNAEWKNRAHFFGMCARIMRQILVDHARTNGYQKRGGALQRVTLDETALVAPEKGAQLVAVDEAMKRLAQIHPRKSEVVELRFFGGLSVEEAAEVLGVSRLTVIRDWNFARAWLLAEMNGQNTDTNEPGNTKRRHE
jgi:RNA polymerase sigma factor (TIGR02999 family)